MGNISPWENAKLKVVGPEVLQRQHRAVVWVPGAPDEPAAVLERLERQNPGHITGSWKIMAENVGGYQGCKGASAILSRKQAAVHTAISLIQEPWLVRGRISGVAACGKLFKPPTSEKPKACVAVKGVDARLIPHLCSRDVVAVELNVADSLGSRKRVVVCSEYFPHDEGAPLPPEPVTRLVEYCQSERLPLIVGCDANSHHTVWGSTDTNDRDGRLLEFLASTDLEILNRGNKPTFCTAVRREVLDLTVCSRCISRDVVGWRVSRELSLLDHRQITFKLAWAKGGTEEELEFWVDHLQRALVESYERNCPERAVKNSRGNSWWNPKLQELRSAAWRAWNRARNTGRQSDWELHRRAQKDYRDFVVRAKKKS
ncbi:uncharacterized protein LOC120358104 [Solenopsis invicta]|uniref:uncharacterized protein LOC120358104 n=1 Tax=Solenopsis invicta TaxID=13686 RepID=UPI00193CC0B0|nr:uncharacterized protein LOC120358104 [Solenopsis invicta]